jgi:hypothetical protein
MVQEHAPLRHAPARQRGFLAIRLIPAIMRQTQYIKQSSDNGNTLFYMDKYRSHHTFPAI